MAPNKQRHRAKTGEPEERPNPRIPSKLMDRIRARARREGKTINLMLLDLLAAGLKVKASLT